MKSICTYSILLVFMLLGLQSNAQLTRDLYRLYHPAYFNRTAEADTSEFNPWGLNKSKKTSYSVELGSSYSSFGGGLASSYVSPTVSFMATEKLHIVAGGRFSRTNAASIPFLSSELGNAPQQQLSGNPTEAFAQLHFQLNDKLSFYGMGVFGKNQLYVSPFQSGVSKTDYQHLSFGMDYKISEKFSIGASFGIDNGPAWGISPFGYSNRISPFFL